MLFLKNRLYNFNTGVAVRLMDMLLQIILSIATALIALAISLFLRRLLVLRLRKTVLDHWIVQTLGVVVIFPPLILAIFAILGIWNPNLFLQLLANFQKLDVRDTTNFVTNVVETLLLTTLGIGVARTMQALTIRGLGESRVDINIRTLIGRIFYIFILTFAVFWILSIWQISIGIPVTVIGVLTVAITFSVQDVLKDLVAGFYILIERPFYIGDQISNTNNTTTYTGKVENVQLRATKLRLLSGEQVTIPNSLVFGGIIVNNSYYSERRATISIILQQEDFTKDQTANQVIQALKDLESVMQKPESIIQFSHYAKGQVTLMLHIWTASEQHSAVSDVMYMLHTLLPNAQLTVQDCASHL